MRNKRRRTADDGRGQWLPFFFSAHWRVCACALGSALVYLVVLVRAYPLLAHYAVPLLDMGKIANYQPAFALAFVISFALLFAFYLAAYRATRDLASPREVVFILGCALALCLILIWVYPIGANDIYDYVFRAREWAVYDYNPHTVTPAQVSGDAWYPYVVWTWAASSYGPVWTDISFALYQLAGDDLLRNLFAFKLLPTVCIVASAIIIYDLLRARGDQNAIAGVLLFAWNPLLLFESVVNAHNDIVMMTCVLAALWLYTRKHFTLALVACVCAALVKVAAVVAWPVLFVACAKKVGAGRRLTPIQIRFIVKALLTCVVVVIALYIPFWRGLETLSGIALQNERFTTSLAAVVKLALEAHVGTASAQTWTRDLFALVFVCVFVFLLSRTPSDERALHAHLLNVFVWLLMIGTLWFQPWYVVWLIALMPLASARQQRIAVVWAMSALGLYILFDFAWVWYADWLNTANELAINLVAVLLWLAPLAAIQLWHMQRPSFNRVISRPEEKTQR